MWPLSNKTGLTPAWPQEAQDLPTAKTVAIVLGMSIVSVAWAVSRGTELEIYVYIYYTYAHIIYMHTHVYMHTYTCMHVYVQIHMYT